jgi:thymidylate synthase
MKTIVSSNIDSIYKLLCERLLKHGKTVNNTVELNNVSFKLTDIRNNIINVRNISESYLLGELLWYMTAREDIDFIQKFSGFWGRISDDGVTSNSAYGHILFKRHGFNQVEKIIELLKTDKNSRRAVLNFNVPNPNVIETKDEICTIALQMYIRDGKLNCTGIMRSNDIWLGTPYDVAFFTELQKYIAHRVGVEYGTYTHFVTSIHVYDRNFEDLAGVLNCKAKTKLTVDIEKLNAYKYAFEEYVVASATPKEEIINLFEKYGVCQEVEI